MSSLRQIVVIRDLKGVVRLAVEAREPHDDARVSQALVLLRRGLEATLGPWFAVPILCSTATSKVERGMVEELSRRAEEWQPPDLPEGWAGPSFRKLERRLSKDAWADEGHAEPPWPLRGKQPPIVAFYSFKGGVGRTTALVGVGALLARRGHRVALVDLDLEAPGLAPFLECATERGILDVLVDHGVTGKIDLVGASANPSAFDRATEERMTVYPAAVALDGDYLEKLGRLDYSRRDHGSTDGPVSTALRDLLASIRASYDFILLDARAGVHDLGGLALQGLAHVDVLVARPSAQSERGLRLAVSHVRRVRGKRMEVVVVHSQAPRDEDAPEIVQFKVFLYDLFREEVYPADDNAPAADDTTAMHQPVLVRRSPDLEYLRTARDMPLGPFEGLETKILETVELHRADAEAPR